MIPMEVIVTIAAAAGSWFLKKKAQEAADLHAERLAHINKSKRIDASADLAAKRSSPWLRKVVALVVILVAFGGLLTVAFFPSIPVTIIERVPKNSLLFGLIKWGSSFEVVSANGFVLPEWVRFSVCTVIGFLFGSGFAKVSR